MKTIVCYPIKSLVNTFMPPSCETLATESADEFFHIAALYKPEAAVIFSETFSTPPWNWIPKVSAALPDGVPIIIVPLYKDEEYIKKVLEESDLQNIYVVSANLTHEEIQTNIAQILKQIDLKEQTAPSGNGLVYAMMSYGSSGITTFCINYPILLAKRNPEKRIAVLDMNVEKPDLTRFFKLERHQVALYRPDLVDLKTARKRNWTAAFRQSTHLSNLYYANAAIKWKSCEISNLLAVLRQQFDSIYIDWGYCFPESEALQRLLFATDRTLFFVRADPFSIENATNWIRKWTERGVDCRILLSHLDKGQVNRIGKDMSVYGVVPRISEYRINQAQRSHSVLVEEFFPPKPYISSLQAIVEAEKKERGVVISR